MKAEAAAQKMEAPSDGHVRGIIQQPGRINKRVSLFKTKGVSLWASPLKRRPRRRLGLWISGIIR